VPGSSLYTTLSINSDPALRDVETQKRRQRDVELRQVVDRRFGETVRDLEDKCAALEASLRGAGLSKLDDIRDEMQAHGQLQAQPRCATVFFFFFFFFFFLFFFLSYSRYSLS
jgi:hypothetical protein